jgi:mono/diheme cytochrome c family protein
MTLNALLLVASLTVAADLKSPREAARPMHAAAIGVGRMLPADPALAKAMGKNGLAIVLTSTTCPLSKKYGPKLASLETALSAQGLGVLFVNPIASDSAGSIDEFCKANGLKSPYVHDAKLSQTIAARSTGDTILIDTKRTIHYRGAIDDQYGLGYQLDAPKQTFLLDAATAMVAGREPQIAATTAPGCELDHGKADKANHDVTYHNRISRIIQANCIDCHRDGGVGPFKLDTPEDVAGHAGMIKKVLAKGTMPPWFAAAEPNGTASKWINDKRLPDSDKADLLAWLNGDRRLGDPADAPLAKSFPDGWSIGKPDLIVTLPKPIAIKADGQMPYSNVIIDPKVTEDHWVRATEIRPTVPGVVHHVLVFILHPGDDPTKDPGMDERRGFFAAYVPGNAAQTLPDGYARKLPKGAKLKFQIHYTPNGKAVNEQMSMGIAYATKAPTYEVKVAGLANPMMRVPPGAERFPQKAVVKSTGDVTILSLIPHMHVRGVAARYDVKLPDGKTITPLDVPHYDFNWQLQYKFAEPLTVPKGSTFTFTAWYDNSSKNPANPDPSAVVRWGQQTTEEMLLGYVEFVVPVGSVSHTDNGPLFAFGFDQDEVFKMVNTSGSGKISFAEFAEYVKVYPRLKEPLIQRVAFDRMDTNKDGFIDRKEFEIFGQRRN